MDQTPTIEFLPSRKLGAGRESRFEVYRYGFTHPAFSYECIGHRRNRAPMLLLRGGLLTSQFSRGSYAVFGAVPLLEPIIG